MKEKIRKKTKRPQTEDMIFTEEDFEDVSEDTKANSPKHRKRSRRTSGGFPARKAGIIAGGVIGVLVLLYLGISVFFMQIPQNSDREVGNLMAIRNHYPKYVVTLNEMVKSCLKRLRNMW